MKNLFFLLLALTFFAGCSDDEDDDIQVCTNFQVGDSIDLPGSTETLFIDAVYQDNRCPCNAVCFVEGGIGIRLLTATNDTLLIGKGDSTVPNDSLSFDGRLLILQEVTTREVCNPADLTQGDYCADFRIE